MTPPPLPKATDLQLPHPDDLTFGELFSVKAATGIDVTQTDSFAEQLLALLWFALRGTEHGRDWPDMLNLTGKDTGEFAEQLRETGAKRDAEARQAAEAAAAVADADAVEAQRRELEGEPDPGPVAPSADPTSQPATGSAT